MLLPKRRWNDNVGQMLSQDSVPRVAEGVLCRGIELSDAALVIDGHNAVERRVHDRCLADLTAIQFPFLYESAFSKFLFELFVGGGKFGSPLHDPLIKFAREPLLMAQKTSLL